MTKEKTLAEPDHAGEWQALDSDLHKEKTLSKKRGGEMCLAKLSSDRLCLSERCPAGLSATVSKPNPPLDRNVQVFRLGLLQNSRDDAVCCSAIGRQEEN